MDSKAIALWYGENVLKRKMSSSEWKLVGSQIKNLHKTYSYEDIMYALQWTARNKRMTKFGLVMYTIEEALKAREEEVKRLNARFKLEMEKAQEKYVPQVQQKTANYKPKPKWIKEANGF